MNHARPRQVLPVFFRETPSLHERRMMHEGPCPQRPLSVLCRSYCLNHAPFRLSVTKHSRS